MTPSSTIERTGSAAATVLEDKLFCHLIDGRMEPGATLFDVINPSTGALLARAPTTSRDQFETAVAAARRAFPVWRKHSFEERRAKLSQFADVLQSHLPELTEILTLEQGKPLAAARAEIERAIYIIRHLITMEIMPELLREDKAGRVELCYKPLGVVGAIAPWNVPIVLAAPKIASALYTGNTIILKPSPYTPLTTLRIGELAREIFPAGVLNILSGGNELGQWMTEHPGIDKINFTGSVATGKRVMASASASMKRVTLELGGNDAAIVLNDVQPKAVAARIFQAAFANSGQVCQAIKRLYVHDDIYEEMVQELAEIARRVKMDDGFEADVDYGPLQNKAQYDRVLEILDDTTRQPGVRIVAGGHAMDRPGYFIAATIVADIAEGTRLVDEEPFGPILPVLRFTDIEEAIARANDSLFGLAGSVWTNDLVKGAEIASRLETGVAWVNHHIGVAPDYPFGGVKESGVGRSNGMLGLLRNMEPQLIVVPPAA